MYIFTELIKLVASSSWQVMLQVASGCENSVDLAQRVPPRGNGENERQSNRLLGREYHGVSKQGIEAGQLC